MEPLSDPLNSLPLVGGLLMWYPSLPVSSKKLFAANEALGLLEIFQHIHGGAGMNGKRMRTPDGG